MGALLVLITIFLTVGAFRPPGLTRHSTALATNSASTKPMSRKKVQAFFQLPMFAVVGASTDRSKFGNKVLRCYQENGKQVVPVNKRTKVIEDIQCVESLAAIALTLSEQASFAVSNLQTFDLSPATVGVSIITPPGATRLIIEEGAALGFRHFFLQPGTFDEEVLELVAQLKRVKDTKGLNVIHGCVLVEFGFDERR
ncbi:CoA binding domain-containing protein [Ochromonadaceae sp. CCMP2298]|nr:CoA binding domain-containing protein [Ochromonadaceae sp. CCMP2298]